MNFQTLKPDNEPDKNINVPLNCTRKEKDENQKELTVFDSKTCPELLTLDTCTLYSVIISAQVFDIYSSLNSSNQQFNTVPRKCLLNHLKKTKSAENIDIFDSQRFTGSGRRKSRHGLELVSCPMESVRSSMPDGHNWISIGCVQFARRWPANQTRM